MMSVLIPYGTTEGLTARISEYVAEVVRGHGHQADAVDIKGSGAPKPDDYDAVIVGASIHMGKHEDYVLDFVRENPDTDTSRDYVYTEWDGVKHFVEEFLETLPPEAARDPQS